jgi:hypothetical protein
MTSPAAIATFSATIVPDSSEVVTAELESVCDATMLFAAVPVEPTVMIAPPEIAVPVVVSIFTPVG